MEPTIYSYFEKGCRKKCTRQARKVLWVVLSSLFFKEIWKNGTRGHGHMFASAKGKQQTYVWQLHCQEQRILIISHITFRDCRMHIVTDKLSRNSCIKDIQRLQSIFICILLNHTISFKPYHLNLGGSFSPNSRQLVTDRQAQFFLISPKLALARSISRRVKVPE